MKAVEDATRIRSRLLLSFERAEFDKDPANRSAHLSFLLSAVPHWGGTAGCHQELAVDVIPATSPRRHASLGAVILIEAGSRLLPTFDPALSEKALRQLVGLGVDVRLGGPSQQSTRKGCKSQGDACAVTTSFGPQVCARRQWYRASARSWVRATRESGAGLLDTWTPERVRHRDAA